MSVVDEFLKKNHEFRDVSNEERELLEKFMSASTKHINDREWDLITNISCSSWDEIREFTDDKFKVAMINDMGRTSNYIWHLVMDENCKDKDVMKNLVWSMAGFSRYEKMILCDELDDYDGRPFHDWSCQDVDARVFCKIYELLQDEEGFKQALLDAE